MLGNRRVRERDAPCRDCGVATAPERWFRQPPWEWYMVHDHVWRAAGMEETDGYLCIGCLEDRLGRTLVAADFRSDMFMNSTDPSCAEYSWWHRTPRLADRLRRERDA
jgi:hypothetical protein